jgi:hypothetical protein
MRKTPVKFPNCTGKAQKNCINFDPVEDHTQWCVPAEQRGSACPNPIPTTQTSSTKRGRNCPRHRGTADPGNSNQETGDNTGVGGVAVSVGA